MSTSYSCPHLSGNRRHGLSGKLRHDWADRTQGWGPVASRPPPGKGGNQGASGEGAGRKPETIGQLSPACAKGGGAPSQEPLKAACASGPREWSQDEAPPHPRLAVASLPTVGAGGNDPQFLLSLLHSGSLGCASGRMPHKALPWGREPCHPSSCDKNFLETVRLNGLGEGAGNHSKNEKQIDYSCASLLLPRESHPHPLGSMASGGCRDTFSGGWDPPCSAHSRGRLGGLATTHPLLV